MFDSTYKELSASLDHVILGTRFVGSYSVLLYNPYYSAQPPMPIKWARGSGHNRAWPGLGHTWKYGPTLGQEQGGG